MGNFIDQCGACSLYDIQSSKIKGRSLYKCLHTKLTLTSMCSVITYPLRFKIAQSMLKFHFPECPFLIITEAVYSMQYNNDAIVADPIMPLDSACSNPNNYLINCSPLTKPQSS